MVHECQKSSVSLTTNTHQLTEEYLEVSQISRKLELNDNFLHADTILNSETNAPHVDGYQHIRQEVNFSI